MPATSPPVSLPDRYRAARRIAAGGMATVFAAEDRLLGRLVAIKVLSPHFAADDAAIERFSREARAAAKDRIASSPTTYGALRLLSFAMKLDLLLFGRITSGPFFALLVKNGAVPDR